jgi:site-specific DNA-cytosine methylase
MTPCGGAAYYNENDEFAADWLRNLIKAGLIADGEVDTRSIVDVRPGDLRGFVQCHFFAGIGGWSYALRGAGWDDIASLDRKLPLPALLSRRQAAGFADERHLWPVWRELIRECDPAIVFGEQVASATEWLGLVRGDLEAMGYAVGAMPIQAASAGADHLRDRYWFVADADDAGSQGRGLLPERAGQRAAGRMVWPTPTIRAHAIAATWPTATACSEKSIRTPEGALTEIERGKSPDLAALAMWQMPVADDAVDRAKGKVNSRGEPKLSGQVIQASTWSTPRANEGTGAKVPPGRTGGPALKTQVSNGSSEQTEKPGALNPEFVCWLMGYPTEWVSCGVSVTRSTTARRKSSSGFIRSAGFLRSSPRQRPYCRHGHSSFREWLQGASPIAGR